MPTLQVSGARVEYIEMGCGEPVVLLHSSASSSAQWRALAEGLSRRYRVVAPDLYGYGGTAHWPGQRAFHLDCEAEIVSALLERIDGPAHFVGHSYGGAVALHVAGLRGGLLRSLTLIEPVAFHLLRGTDDAAFVEIKEVGEGVVRAVARGEYVAGIEGFIDYWNGPGASAALLPDRRQAMAARLPKIALDFHATFHAPTRLDDYRSLAAPTLLLHGTESPTPTRRICELLAPVLPRARLKTLSGAGHMAPVTHRDQVNALVTAHLDSNSGRAPQLAAAPTREPAGAARTVDPPCDGVCL